MKKIVFRPIAKAAAGFIIVLAAAFIFAAYNTQAQSSTQTVQYEYDDAGRLVRALYPDDIEIRYTYDDAGNLLQRRTGEAQVAVDSWPLW